MARERTTAKDSTTRRQAPRTPAGQQARMIEQANKLAMAQLEDGTASAQLVTHLVKLGSLQSEVELEQRKLDLEFTRAKMEALESSAKLVETLGEALEAFKTYNPYGNQPMAIEDVEFDP